MTLDPEDQKYLAVLARLNRIQGDLEITSCRLSDSKVCSNTLSKKSFFNGPQIRRPCTEHVAIYEKLRGWSELE